MGDYTDEELNALVVAHAKYFTVVQVKRGGFVAGGSNYDRHQVSTIEDARIKAKELYETDRTKGILIYAVADFAGANGFSRPIENYPKSTYMTRADKIKKEKEDRRRAKELAREARLNLGSKKPARIVEKPHESSMDLPEGFEDADEALFYITAD